MASSPPPEPDGQSVVLRYTRAPDQDAPRAVRYPVIVVDAGPLGCSAAIDLAQQDVPVLLLHDDDRLSTGSHSDRQDGTPPKKAAQSESEFRRHWRDVHGPLAAQLSELRRYHQNSELRRYHQNHVVDRQEISIFLA
jgi:flavin-dependent dehydrogenase